MMNSYAAAHFTPSFADIYKLYVWLCTVMHTIINLNTAYSKKKQMKECVRVFTDVNDLNDSVSHLCCCTLKQLICPLQVIHTVYRSSSLSAPPLLKPQLSALGLKAYLAPTHCVVVHNTGFYHSDDHFILCLDDSQ